MMKLLPLALAGTVLSVVAAAAPAAASPSTIRVSLSTSGGQAEPTPAQLKEPGVHRMRSDEVSVSDGGRFAVFRSNAVNLVPGDTNGSMDVFRRDLTTGVTTRVNVSSEGAQSSASYSGKPSMSADGRYVAFTSFADNLVPGDTNERPDMFVRDVVAGTTVRVSVSQTGEQDSGHSQDGVISADGRFVAYETFGSSLIDDHGPVSNVVVKNLVTGAVRRVSVPLLGGALIDGGYGVRDLAISADGGKVAFVSHASNLVAGDTNGATDVFVRDLAAGTTTRVNVGAAGAEANGSSEQLSMSADGRYVAFDSLASNLAEGDTDRRDDVFVHDLATGTTRFVAVGAPEDSAASPSISGDGSRVGLVSVTRSPSYRYTVHVHELSTGQTTLVSGSAAGGAADDDSMEPSISGDGKFVGFTSYASNLVAGDTNEHKDAFVRRLG